jgi:hypothetical protein
VSRGTPADVVGWYAVGMEDERKADFDLVEEPSEPECEPEPQGPYEPSPSGHAVHAKCDSCGAMWVVGVGDTTLGPECAECGR